MDQIDVVRVLKDPEYRNSLTDEQKALLPAIANVSLLADDALDQVIGGRGANNISVAWTVTDVSCKSLQTSCNVQPGPIVINAIAGPAPCT